MRFAAVAVARELERRRPDILTAAWWKEERGERIFVDYNQNAPHKTVFGAWSVRARVGAQVSTPVSWDELDEIDPDELTLATVPARLERDGDPWAEIDVAPQSLEPLLELHERDRAAGLHGRAVAAGLSEAAGRAAAGRAEPGAAPGLTAQASAEATTSPMLRSVPPQVIDDVHRPSVIMFGPVRLCTSARPIARPRSPRETRFCSSSAPLSRLPGCPARRRDARGHSSTARQHPGADGAARSHGGIARRRLSRSCG